MAKAVLISIRPEWVNKIIAGEKTVEIRKTKPNLETPFKCYMYETQGKSDTPWIDEDGHMIFRGRGKVVGELTCDRIDEYDDDTISSHQHEDYARWNDFDLDRACMHPEDFQNYANGKWLYGWHISKLEIYDTPKPLSEFSRPFEICIGKVCDEYGCAYCKNGGHIKRPPQSWRYVEELK